MKEVALTIGGTPIPNPGVPTGGILPVGQNILTVFIALLFIIAVVLAVVFLIVGGIRWVLSGGDAKAIEGARKQITYAIIGLIIVFLAFFIINLLGGFFRIQLVR